MTDNISERGMQKFVTKVVRDEFKATEIAKIKTIYSHYKRFLNKGVAHQDIQSIQETLSAFPNSDVIEKDMQHLKDLYNKLTKEICKKYISIERKPYDYKHELEKLASAK